MDIEKMVKKYYNDLKNNGNSNVDDVMLYTFCVEYFKIKKLKEEYLKDDVNRKEIGLEILERKEEIESLIRIFEADLKKDTGKYNYSEYVSDYPKLIELLLLLANKNEDKYGLKKFFAMDFGHNEVVECKIGSMNIEGEIWVIGEKALLNSLDNTKPYYDASFGAIATKILREGNSLAIITNHAKEMNVLPYRWYTNANVSEFKVKELCSDLCCYTYDDELGDAVNLIKNYVDTYGGDIDNIDIEVLLNKVNKAKQKKKELH